MPTQYDNLSSTYSATAKVPAQAIIPANVRDALPGTASVAGLDMLELACGSGDYTRRLLSSEWGPAASVLAIDISPAMVDALRTRCADLVASDETTSESGTPRLETTVGDCTEPDLLSSLGVPHDRRFDVVLGVWLLNYAADEAALARMWANIASHLKPNGCFVGVIPNLDLPPYAEVGEGTGHPKYGTTSVALEHVPGGWRHRVTIRSEPVVEFDNYRLNDEGEALYTRGMRQAGMRGWERRKMQPPPEDVKGKEPGFWDDWLQSPSSEVCIAYKS